MVLGEGDTVLTANMREQKSSLTEKKYLIMRQHNDVLAVIG